MLVPLLLCFEAEAQHDPYAIAYDGGRLVYFSDSENNRIPDYSHAGYRGGGVSLPDIPVKIEIGPVEGDNRAHIQNAINQVSKMSLDSNGHRGAVLLKPGNYWINGNLYIRESGVVLRGSGDDEKSSENTIIKVAQSVRGDVLQIGDEKAVWYLVDKNVSTTMKTSYIPVGARSFEVKDPDKFEVGDNIILRLISTQQWLDSVNGGDTESDPDWEPGYLDMFYNRTVVSKQDSVLTIDAPVYNHVDTTLSAPRVYKPVRSHLVTESGVENLRIEIQTGGELSESHAENGVVFRGVENAWARDVTVLHFIISGFSTNTSKNVTIKDSRALEPHSKIEAGKRYNFNVGPFSSQILFTNVRSSAGRRDFVSNGTSVTSGIVFHDSRSFGALNSSEGHQRWSQGLLFDSITYIDPQFYNILSLHNRGDFGSSHGWAAVHSTAWNIEAEDHYIFVQKPPGAQNYAIGNRAIVNGEGLFNQPEGYIQGTGLVPFPPSLYEAQLAERLEYGLPPDMPLMFNLSEEKEGAVVISWKQLPPLGTEIIIERSEDGFRYDEIARIPAVEGVFEDQSVLEKEYSYRIRAFREGQYSAYTFPESAVPRFTEESLSDFDLLSPASGSGFIIEGEPESTILFEWEEAESNLGIMYKWQLLDKEEPEKVFFERDSLQATEVTLTFGDIQNLMIENGVEEGDSLKALWTVYAESITLQKRAERILPINFERAVVFDSDLLNGEEAFLDQNYPNPFNPITTIEYHLAEDSQVKLSVYNISGVKIADLDDGFKERGTHMVTFDAGNVASGVYFYRLQTNSVVQIRKMLLIK
jgi:hypothetical protein